MKNQVNVDMKEKVELGSIQADIRESNRTKCLNIPRAKVAKCIFQVLENIILKVTWKYFASSEKCFSGYVHEHQGQQAVCGEQGGVRPEAEDQRLQKHSMVDIFQLSRSHARSSGPNAPLAVGRSVGWCRGLAVSQSVTSRQSVQGKQSQIIQKVYELD